MWIKERHKERILSNIVSLKVTKKEENFTLNYSKTLTYKSIRKYTFHTGFFRVYKKPEIDSWRHCPSALTWKARQMEWLSYMGGIGRASGETHRHTISKRERKSKLNSFNFKWILRVVMSVTIFLFVFWKNYDFDCCNFQKKHVYVIGQSALTATPGQRSLSIVCIYSVISALFIFI